jgi:ring-1,2-phenylacetyl-CoA epoxidase subunit PaaE
MAEGETVLEAGLRAGIDVPWSCRGGMCCTCRARVTEGAVEMDQNYSLQPWETEAGFVLTCQSRPRTPLVAVDYDAV